MFLKLIITLALGIGLNLNARESAIEAVDTKNLRVCADPSNLPFSNEKGEGFENDIAELLGEKLNIPVVYEFFPQVIGYVRNTLNKKKCDILIGITANNDLVLVLSKSSSGNADPILIFISSAVLSPTTKL